MNATQKSMEFSGERFVPGKSCRRIEADHIERYRFASTYVKNKAVLDIACGSGYGSRLLTEAGASQYVGVDISEESIRYATQEYNSVNTSFLIGDICNFRSTDSYGIIVCFETIEHVSCIHSALDNLYSMLNSDGMLIISSPNRIVTSPRARNISDKPANKYHVQEFTPNELESILNNRGFHVNTKEIFGQRQRYSDSIIQTLIRATHFPDIFAFITSPKLTPVVHLTPRYFVIIARKKKNNA